MNTNTDIVYKDESYAIMGACFNVYNDMGTGFLEAVGFKLGILVNLGHYPKLEYERIVI